uniref:Uncharacterized protein n=1 Tax=Solanum lycopersicum TaxID=4081 RepID=A0A3Q7F4F9_SOLLC
MELRIVLLIFLHYAHFMPSLSKGRHTEGQKGKQIHPHGFSFSTFEQTMSMNDTTCTYTYVEDKRETTWLTKKNYLYKLERTNVALVTSLRDGMNLVSYEFVACQASKKGVLILSEFAGAAQSLGAGAILVNPWNITELASSIGYALTMSANEREKRHQHNFLHVTTHTSQEWAETFVSELNDTVVEAQLRTRHIPPQLPSEVAIERYLQSNNRLLILYFGVNSKGLTTRKFLQYDTAAKFYILSKENS